MLNSEEAAARLAALGDADWRGTAAKRVRRLRRKLRGPAEAFLATPTGFELKAQREHQERVAEASVRLDELSDSQLRDVMTALHPGLGDAMAWWWGAAITRPYQRGWARRAFRAPSSPQVTRAGRASDLLGLVEALGPHADADAVWLAAWGGHLAGRAFRPAPFGGLVAAAIDVKPAASNPIVETLFDVGNGEHPTGVMGRYLIEALLIAHRPDGWDYIQRMLLAAQRQEGLRQSILETADEAHPAAFDLLLTTLLDHGLLRFASAVRAVCVWLGFSADVTEIPKVEDRVRTLLALRTDEWSRHNALASGDPWDTYIALCAAAMRDVVVTKPEIEALLRHPSADIRATAVRFASATGMMFGEHCVLAALDDPDLTVAGLAGSLLGPAGLRLPTAFDALTRLVPRLPVGSKTIPAFGVPPSDVQLMRQRAASRLVPAAADRPVSLLVAWVPEMDAGSRAQVARLVARQAPLTGELRQALIDMLADRSSAVRAEAVKALRTTALSGAEAPQIEALLTRSATDVRRAALTLLASLPREAALASVERLRASGDKAQREGAAELGRALGAEMPAAATDAEQAPASDLIAVPAPSEDLRATMLDDRRRTPPRIPSRVRRAGGFADDTAWHIADAIDDIAETQKNVQVTMSSWQGATEVLLADLRHFPSPFGHRAAPASEEETGNGLVLGDLFRSWWAQRPSELRGQDGLDALRAYGIAHGSARPTSPFFRSNAKHGWWFDNVQSLVDVRSVSGGAPQLRHRPLVVHVLQWLMVDDANAATVEECLDAVETLLAMVPRTVLTEDPAAGQASDSYYQYGHGIHHADWRNLAQRSPWYSMLGGLLQTRPELFTREQLARWFGLLRWVEQPHPGAVPLPVDDRLLTAAHAIGVATDDDVIAAFLDRRNRLFHDLTRHWRKGLEAKHPALVTVADSVRDRVLAVELERGDLPTPTSAVAGNIGSVTGVELTVGLLSRLGKAPLQRGWTRGASDSKDAVLSHLIRVSFPASTEVPETLTASARAAKIAQARLVDLAIYAPQWAELVERSLQWPGLASGVLWLHAHTKDAQWSVDHELRQSWAAMVAERTPLAAEDLVSGAVDVDWFRECHGALGDQRWRVVYKAAKHASGGNGHRRAQVFAEAMLGQSDEMAVIERITSKRNQDAVRALGLLPLPEDVDERHEAVQRRYAVLCEFERGIKQFGSQRQSSERTALRIGVDNLARTAGYADPARFIWAVEAAEAGDLADGPVGLEIDDVTLTLSVSDEGVPNLSVRRADRTLQSVPAALRKRPDVVELRARKTGLTRQATRVRVSLEDAMVAQDPFTDADFAALSRHPVVAPMLSQLVWMDEKGRTGKRDGDRLLTVDGEHFSPQGPLRLAHPIDLVDSQWLTWQERVFAAARRQPFKQVFRELYVVTEAERSDLPISRRYEGHQVQPRQALALFTRRGWLASYESGDASRVFHRHAIAARVDFVDGFLTPMEADLPTVGGVYFTRRGDHLALPLDSVPPIVFSEVMRDLDLVVSVAHAGGVDPEASASTTEMRANLIRETARLMKLTNLSFTGSHVVIEGSLGEYSVHLGSGTVHRRPGGVLCIVPIGSQHRGRLFLPFADDDPKTAEVVAKTLLLARDKEIKDPTILQQLRS